MRMLELLLDSMEVGRDIIRVLECRESEICLTH